MKQQIPNVLTILRFLMVPVFLYYLFVSTDASSIKIALFVFIAASITDYLDGFLARKLQVISNFGKIMDPLADKALVISALAGLCWLYPYKISVVVFFVIFFRELLITILREIYHHKGIVMAADKMGKLKTVMQMVGIIVALAAWAYLNPLPDKVILGVAIWFWIVAGVTLLSGLNYLLVLFKKEQTHA